MSNTPTHSENVFPTPHIGADLSSVRRSVNVESAALTLMRVEWGAQAENPGLGPQELGLPMASLWAKNVWSARKAITDDMTGLLNREGISAWFERYEPESFAVLAADLRNFKAINDGHNEEFGDRVINWMAQNFPHKLRTTPDRRISEEPLPVGREDNRPHEGSRDRRTHFAKDAVCRWGGDEIVSIVDLSKVENGRRPAVMRSIRNRLDDFGTFQSEWRGEDVEIPLSIRSAYVHGSPEHTLVEMIDAANDAVTRLKSTEKQQT